MENEKLIKEKIRDAQNLLVDFMNNVPDVSTIIWQNVLLNMIFHNFAVQNISFEHVEKDLNEFLNHFRKNWDKVQEIVQKQVEEHEKQKISKGE